MHSKELISTLKMCKHTHFVIIKVYFTGKMDYNWCQTVLQFLLIKKNNSHIKITIKKGVCSKILLYVKQKFIFYKIIIFIKLIESFFLSMLYYILIQRRQKNKRNRNKTCEHSKSEHVFTPDISGYDSLVISRPEDNYQELNTVTADRWTITMSPLTIWHILFVLFVNMCIGAFTFESQH